MVKYIKDKRIKIGDMGMSTIVEGNELVNTRVGTPLYIAPELVKKNDGNIFICGENENVKKYLKYNHVFKYIAEINDELCAMNLMKG